MQTLNQKGIVVDLPELATSTRKSVIHVLHVDDDPSILEISKLLLTDLNSSFDIDNACCVDEALGKLSARHYDVVVSDYEMPKKNGLEFLQVLKEQKNEIPFILFTGKGREEVAIKALNLGGDGYYNKQGSTETVYGELANGIRLAAQRMSMKNQLVESEQKYSTVFENSPDAIVIFSRLDQKISEINKAAEQLWGYSKNEIIGHSSNELNLWAVPSERDRFYKILQDNGNVRDFEANYRTKSGEIKTVLISADKLEIGNKPFQGIIRDITQRKKTEVELQQKYEVLERVGEGVGAGLAIISRNYEVFWANSTLRNLGVVPTKKCYQTFNHLDKVCPDCGVKKIFEQNASFDAHEYKTVDQKGELTWIELRATPLKDLNGNVTSALELAVSITERKKTENTLKESEEKFRNLAEESPNMIFINKKGKVVYANKKCAEKMGYKQSEICSQDFNFMSLIAPESLDILKSAFSKHIRGEEVGSYEYLLITKDGKKIAAEINSKLICYEGEKAILGVVTDITEHKKTEEALREADNRLQKISTQTPGMLYEFKKCPDGTYRVPFTSEAIQNIFGCSPQDVQEDFSPIAKVILPEDLKKVISSIEYSAKNLTPWTCKYRVKIPGKEAQWVWGQSTPEKLEDGSIIWYGYNVDITEGQKIEDALTQSKQKFSALFAANPDATVFYDHDFHVLEANPKFCTLFGFSIDEIKGKDIVDLIVPGGVKEETEDIRQRIKSGLVEIITTRKRKDGSEIPLLLTGSPVFLNEKAIGSIFVFKEITEIITVQEELSKALSKAQQLNEKLTVVGSLTRHDVRNKLSVVTGYSYILKKKHADLTDVVNALEKMELAVRESIKIFDFAKAYELIGVEDLVDVDVAKSVEEAVGMFSGLTFKIVNDCQGLTVRADSLLRQLIYNFIDNTKKYGQKTTMARVYYQKVTSGELQLIYEDDGVGIPEENKEQLFKQGFSTGGSTGFGLFLSKKMIDVYGWTITEEGKPDQGAKFVMKLPLISKE